MFRAGRRHYSERMHEVDNEELQLVWRMFRLKYWGNVENDIWEANNEAAIRDEGEITAKYNVCGVEVCITRMQDCSYAVVHSPSETDFLENVRRSRQRERESSPRRRTLGDSLFA